MTGSPVDMTGSPVYMTGSPVDMTGSPVCMFLLVPVFVPLRAPLGQHSLVFRRIFPVFYRGIQMEDLRSPNDRIPKTIHELPTQVLKILGHFIGEKLTVMLSSY